jgi:uncharacterized C2H2 Zn-finger protein
MTSDKRSRNEDEYFAREEAERLQKLRERNAAERVAAERGSHHMRCPKCGGVLHTELFHGVQADRCHDCHGFWLDSGELELLMKDEEHGLLRRVMRDMLGSVRKLKAGS